MSLVSKENKRRRIYRRLKLPSVSWLRAEMYRLQEENYELRAQVCGLKLKAPSTVMEEENLQLKSEIVRLKAEIHKIISFKTENTTKKYVKDKLNSFLPQDVEFYVEEFGETGRVTVYANRYVSPDFYRDILDKCPFHNFFREILQKCPFLWWFGNHTQKDIGVFSYYLSDVKALMEKEQK